MFDRLECQASVDNPTATRRVSSRCVDSHVRLLALQKGSLHGKVGCCWLFQFASVAHLVESISVYAWRRGIDETDQQYRVSTKQEQSVRGLAQSTLDGIGRENDIGCAGVSPRTYELG